MSKLIQAVRGMNDILPEDSLLWQQAESRIRRTMRSYGYQEIRTPILEKTELFKRSIGEVTDIVEKEMYTFPDRNEESMTMRPEGTACVVRAGVQHGLLYNQIQRLWYQGPYFRYERPQKGRYRQFHQCSAEVFGLPGPDIDAEIIVLSAHILERLGLKSFVNLKLNTLGSNKSRSMYREVLVKYLEKNKKQLDEDSLRRLESNPLRILDSKNPKMKQLIEDAPKLLDHLDPEAVEHFDLLKKYLNNAGIKYEVDPCLVRGLDYYNSTVFEWSTDKLGSQDAVAGGGRYDGLVEQLGGKPTPALGFSIGMERAILLMQQSDEVDLENKKDLHVYLITDGDKSFVGGLKVANYLRSNVKNLRLLLHCGGGSIKSQFKKADKSGARYAVIVGEHEMKTNCVSLKFLREDLPQQTLYQDELAEYLKLKIK